MDSFKRKDVKPFKPIVKETNTKTYIAYLAVLEIKILIL